MAVTSSPRPSVWTAYDAWNQAIHDWFFTGRFEQQPVYLDLETEVLEQLAINAGATGDDPGDALVKAVVGSLSLNGDVFYPHIARTLSWEEEGSRATPPFLALLAFF